MISKPAFIQGSFNFRGEGFDTQLTLQDASYTVPARRSAKLVYFRAGQSSDELINLVLTRDGEVMRLFPVGAKDSMHFPLAITEDLPAGCKLELKVAAPENLRGSVFVDLGFMEESAPATA